MRAAHIRTADFVVCDSIAEAKHWINHHRPPYVIKADGLAAGKGVLICDTAAAALSAAAAMLHGQFGTASKRILLEEHLSGRELSFIVLTDGKKALPLPICRDYKRLCDGDSGPNTGGMGAYSPVFGRGIIDRADYGRSDVSGIATDGRIWRAVLRFFICRFND